MWDLPAGAPMNAPYVRSYLRSVPSLLNGAAKSVSQELRPRDGADIVDVILTFR